MKQFKRLIIPYFIWAIVILCDPTVSLPCMRSPQKEMK